MVRRVIKRYLIVTGMNTDFVLLGLMAVFVLRRPLGVLDLDTYRDRPNETNMWP